MIKNPYNITLSTTKKNFFTVLLVIILMLIGFILMHFDGFDKTYVLSRAGADVVDGFSTETNIYVINFIFGFIVIIAALAVILMRHDILGIISGVILLLFAFLVLTVGYNYTTGGIANVHKKNNLTFTTIVIDKITNL